ncbi:lipoyl synthase [Spirochaetia bacterium]|nr:lipoyl synthase [Spirochaetia bacterium]
MVLKTRQLRTVCDEAHCPNKSECWESGTATFMVMGDVCTRNCRFCAVNSGPKGKPLRADEGAKIAAAVKELGLSYAVITSVDRDDLEDRGSSHIAACIRAIKLEAPDLKIEVLIPDYTPAELECIIAAAPDVLAHNVETVRRLQNIRDHRASFDASLRTLKAASCGGLIIKSSILLGFGEREDEIFSAMDELRDANVSILVMGQYMRPSKQQLPVTEYITPELFTRYAEEGRKRGFATVISTPLARTSYHAKDVLNNLNIH